MSLMVSSKGIEHVSTIDRVEKAIRRLGLGNEMVIKVDNEGALKKLRELVLDRFPAGAVPQEPAAGESASNGVIASGVKIVKGLWRVHLHALEAKLEGYIPSDHPTMAWMAEYVGDCITKSLVAADGKTGYERLYGKESRDEGLEFGECLLWRSPHVQGVVLDERWKPGVWLGRRWGSPVHLVFCDGKVHEVRSIQRRPRADRWSRAAVEAVSAYPWSRPDQEEPPVVIHHEKTEVKAPVPEGNVVSRVHIKVEDLNTYGYQANCPRCRLIQSGGKRSGIKHLESCRRRIEDAMRAAGDPRVIAADERINAELARRIEAKDREAAAKPHAEEERRTGGAGEDGAGEDAAGGAHREAA